MDIKHVLSVEPAASRLPRRRPPGPTVGPGPQGWVEHAGGLVEIGHDGARVRVRQRGAPPQRVPRALRTRPTGP